MKTRTREIPLGQRQASRYGKDPVYRWNTAEDFHSAAVREDGVHVIGGPGGSELELLLGGQPFEQLAGPVLVVFSGAVTKRSERVPPFFSGRGIAERSEVPFIAISDPALNLAPDLNIAWYAGTQAQDVQSQVETALSPLSERLGRDLWMVGGSAGAFAALELGHRFGRNCSVFVWNPQTDVAEYSPPLVKAYATRAFPSHARDLTGPQWKQRLRDVMSFYGRRRSLLDFLPSHAPARLFYLQSASDWHVQKHCGPYLDAQDYRRLSAGLWARSADQVVWMADTGQGHAPPSTDKVVEILKRLFHTDTTVLQVTHEWRRTELFPAYDTKTCPDDLRPVAAWLERTLEIGLEGASVIASSRTIAPGTGGLRADMGFLDPSGARLGRAAQFPVPGQWTGEMPPGTSQLNISFRDGLDHLLFEHDLKLEGGMTS